MEAMATRREFMRSALGGVLLCPALSSLCPRLVSADDEKVAKELAKLDALFVKALTELAKKYDKDQVPEAAHFFASVALGLGAKDEGLSPIKGSYEASVYLGRLRGGEPLKDTAPITSALGNVSTSYKKILEPWIKSARKGGLAEDTRKVMLDTGVKYELARGANEYVQAVQRFNALRKSMGVRAILWDFQSSKELILVAWYTSETEDWEYKDLRKDSPFFTKHVDEGKRGAGGPLKISELPEVLRSYALARQQILNPNARVLQLGFWSGGAGVEYTSLYGIPQLPYRDDIPTPTQRFKGETLVKDWVDIEETIQVGNKKIPYVRYPFSAESDTPTTFSNGKGAAESGWSVPEHGFRDRAGVPIMLRFYQEAILSDVQATLKDKAGKEQPCRVYLSGDKRVHLEAALPTVLMLPESPLAGLSEYTVTVSCKLDDTKFDKSWTFKTRPK
jgi:hypothetical protein